MWSELTHRNTSSIGDPDLERTTSAAWYSREILRSESHQLSGAGSEANEAVNVEPWSLLGKTAKSLSGKDKPIPRALT